MRDTVTSALEVAGMGCLVAAAWIGLGMCPGLAVTGVVLVGLGYLLGRS